MPPPELALSRLNHPNIATIHDFDSDRDIDFLVVELIPGTTRDARVAAGPIAEAEVVQLGLQLAEGLRAAHREGVVHRDLKPGKLRVTPDGQLKILDFALARHLPGHGLAGLAFGVPAVWLGSRAMSTVIFGVAPHDPPDLLGAAARHPAIVLVACYRPARRATRIDPVRPLEED